MTLFYDESLRHKLPATNTGDGVVLNRRFEDCAADIADHMRDYYLTDDHRYRSSSNQRLLNLCMDHADEYQQPITGNTTIMLTHPLFLQLVHMQMIEKDTVRKEVGNYLDQLFRFLRLCFDRQKANVVLLETAHHYAAATSLLAESGLVTQVVFTECDRGDPLFVDELVPFGDHEIYFAGGYNGCCLNKSIQAMNAKLSTGKLSAIRELVLNPPWDYISTLKVELVLGLNSEQMVSLDEVVVKLKDSSKDKQRALEKVKQY